MEEYLEESDKMDADKNYKLVVGNRAEMEVMINALKGKWQIETLSAVHTPLNLIFYTLLKRRSG